MLALLLALFLAVSGLARAAEPESFASDQYQLAAELSEIHELLGALLVCPEGKDAATVVEWALDQTPWVRAEVLLLEEDGTGPETIEGGLMRLSLACGVRVHAGDLSRWHLEAFGECGSYWPDTQADWVFPSYEPPQPTDSRPKLSRGDRVAVTVVLVVLGVVATVAVVGAVFVLVACQRGCTLTGAAIGLRDSPSPAHATVAGVGPAPLPALGFRF